MKKFLTTVTVVASALAPVFYSDIQGFMTTHPQIAAGVGALAMILSYLAPSPVNRHVKPSADQN